MGGWVDEWMGTHIVTYLRREADMYTLDTAEILLPTQSSPGARMA